MAIDPMARLGRGLPHLGEDTLQLVSRRRPERLRLEVDSRARLGGDGAHQRLVRVVVDLQERHEARVHALRRRLALLMFSPLPAAVPWKSMPKACSEHGRQTAKW